jgi:hypothetical protein
VSEQAPPPAGSVTGLHIPPEELRAYAETCATVIVETDALRLTFAARIETRDVEGVPGLRRVVLDNPDEHELQLLLSIHETALPTREQLARMQLAGEIVASIGLDCKPTSARPLAPWESRAQAQNEKG